MSSFRGSMLRCLLLVRKASIEWNMSVESLRAMQAWTDRLVTPPRGTAIAPALTTDVAAEWFTPSRFASQGVLLYVHGGGWTVGLHNLERRMLARVCQAARVRAFAVHYRLAPEHPFPAALEDCVAAYRCLLKSGTSPRTIVLVGTSAGGNLTLATLDIAGGRRPPSLCRCLYFADDRPSRYGRVLHSRQRPGPESRVRSINGATLRRRARPTLAFGLAALRPPTRTTAAAHSCRRRRDRAQ